MVARKPLGALLAAAIFAGCTVGPDYHPPEEAMVNAPAAQAPFTSGQDVTSATEPPDHWWRLFDDPQLDQLVERALTSNYDLRIAEANLQRTEALLDEVRSTREVDGVADFETYWTQQSAEAVLQHVRPHQHQIFNAGVGVSYDLDLFGGIRRGIEAATADTEAAVAARDLVRVNIAAETAQAYAELCNAGHQIELLRQLVSVQTDEVRMHEALVVNGRAPEYEQERRQGGLEETRARLPQLEALRRNAAIRLTTLSGLPPSQVDTRLLECHKPLQLSVTLPVGDGQSLLKRRPDIRAAERRLAAATARIGVSTAALYPDIKLGAQIGSTGGMTDAFTPLTNRFAVGPMVSWDFRQSTVRARIAQAQAQTRGSLAAFDATVLRALREVESTLNNYNAALTRRTDLEHSSESAVHVAYRTTELRNGGRIGGLAALDAQRNSLAAQQALAASQAVVNANQIAVFLALGGGWM